MIGSKLATIVATVITFGRKSQTRALLHGRDEIGVAEVRTDLPASAFYRFLEINDHDDAGLNRRAEKSDVADPHSDAEIEPHQVLQKDAATQSERHGENDVGSFLRVAIDE